jgi:glucose-6-phosphate 1-dehydrogenase
MSTAVGSQSDALVFFGATGDLAYKQVFPALYAKVRDAHLSVPIVGVAGRPWTSDQLRQIARESIAEQDEIDEATFARLASLLSCVDSNYNESSTYAACASSGRGRKTSALPGDPELSDAIPVHEYQPGT